MNGGVDPYSYSAAFACHELPSSYREPVSSVATVATTTTTTTTVPYRLEPRANSQYLWRSRTATTTPAVHRRSSSYVSRSPTIIGGGGGSSERKRSITPVSVHQTTSPMASLSPSTTSPALPFHLPSSPSRILHHRSLRQPLPSLPSLPSLASSFLSRTPSSLPLRLSNWETRGYIDTSRMLWIGDPALQEAARGATFELGPGRFDLKARYDLNRQGHVSQILISRLP
jgi:hypothetical protein